MPDIVVVGGGIAGLAAAWKLARDGPVGPAAGGAGGGSTQPSDSLRVTLVEASPRFGGKIVTERVDDFLVEGGADSFASRKPRGVGLVRELGLGERLVPTGSSGLTESPGGGRRGAARVHVVRGDRLVPLPAGLSLVVPTRAGPIVRSPLLSFRGKLRLGLDLVLPRRDAASGDRARGSGGSGDFGRDESVAELIRRRFGSEYLERLAGPLLAGIHSTDPEELSVAAAFPHLREMERRHRSLLLAARKNGARRRPPAEAGRGGPPSPDTAAARVSLAGGMGELVEALVAALRRAGVELLPGREVIALERRPGGGWRLRLAGGDPGAGEEEGRGALDADAVVLAAPAAATAHLLSGLEPGLAAALGAISHVSSATVSLGYPRAAVGRPLDGLGFLVPRDELCRVSACTFSSEKFADRAPEGYVLLRAFVGGGWAPRGAAGEGDPTGRADADLVALAHEELARLLGLTAEPVLARVHRFREANPQYRVGHLERIGTIERATPPGLVLAGCAYHGLGVPDCIASGERAARRALEAVAP